MSEQEKSGHNATEDVVVVEPAQEPTASIHKAPFRPNELQDERPSQLHIRSKAPAVPFIEELKNEPDARPAPPSPETRREKKDVDKKSSDLHKRASKRSKRRESRDSPESIELTTVEIEPMREKMTLPAQPIPADQMSITSVVSEPIPKAVGKLLNEEELAALAPKTPKRISEWSDEDEEEAGGLPRSMSRASRVSRAVRQLLCCGTAYSAPSEDDISTDRMASGI